MLSFFQAFQHKFCINFLSVHGAIFQYQQLIILIIFGEDYELWISPLIMLGLVRIYSFKFSLSQFVYVANFTIQIWAFGQQSPYMQSVNSLKIASFVVCKELITDCILAPYCEYVCIWDFLSVIENIFVLCPTLNYLRGSEMPACMHVYG